MVLGDLLEELVRGDGQEPDSRVILAIDQLEEVDRQAQDPGERSSFLDALADITQDPRSSITVVLTVADFLTELAVHREMARPLADNTVLVGPPTPAEIARAVEAPALTAGLRVDVGLTDAIVADAGGKPGLLPLLSTALTRLWTARDGDRLTLPGYVGIGGLTGAIPGLAEEAFGTLSGPDQAAARVLFLRLTGPGANAATFTRRRVPLAELAALPDPAVRAVVDPLASARLLTVAGEWVEVAHRGPLPGMAAPRRLAVRGQRGSDSAATPGRRRGGLGRREPRTRTAVAGHQAAVRHRGRRPAPGRDHHHRTRIPGRRRGPCRSCPP